LVELMLSGVHFLASHMIVMPWTRRLSARRLVRFRTLEVDGDAGKDLALP
jgi:hypothetical protein